MGMDFSALLKYDGFSRCQRQIRELERQSPAAFSQVLEKLKHEKYYPLWEKYHHNAWADPESSRQVKRPKKFNIEVELRTPEGFFLYFGRDAIYIYHCLRWRVFLTEIEWQQVMLGACAAICQHFDSEECILAHDCHSAMLEFHENKTFDCCLEAVPEIEAEVTTFEDLYIEIPDNDCQLVMKPDKRIVLRDPDKPLPPDWQRPTIWDSKGYWRFDWRSYLLDKNVQTT